MGTHDPVFILMLEMSIKHFGEVWADGLEYILWHEVFDHNIAPENYHMAPHERFQLLHAAESNGYWWIQTGPENFQRVPLSEWSQMYLSEFGDML